MTYAEAIQFLCNLRMFGAVLGLDTTVKLAALAGNPQQQLRFIHVAGTNGKGSTCAMLESIYRAAGLRVGLFTSPHLVSFRERIQVNRLLIAEADVVRLVAELRDQSSAGFQPAGSAGIPARSSPTGGRDAAQTRTQDACAALQPTFFEFVTVMALRYFAEQKCDLVIWETGLGGRLDATNIVTPLASVITSIGLDHQNWLGDTVEKIALEKAGIIKPGVPVITSASPGHGLKEIADTARQRQSPLTVVGCADTNQPPLDKIQLPLIGQHQRLNAALALATVRALAKILPVTEQAIRKGLARVHWPGRMQLVKTPGGQRILLDGAHNPEGVEALGAALPGQFPDANPTFVLGVLADKDWKTMVPHLAKLAGRFLLVPVNSERTLAPEKMAPVCREANPDAPVSVCSSLSEALKLSANDEFIVITGSLYLVGEAMELLRLSPIPAQDERGLNEWTSKP